MPSEVDLCNLALSMLGDDANVSSIEPPDGSAQSVYCSRFYPTARDALLELHDWNFASRRAALTLLGDATLQTGAWCNQWRYTYGVPNKMIAARAVLDVNAPDDCSASSTLPGACSTPFAMPALSGGLGLYTPQPFIVETLETGELVIRTNQQNAMLRYTVRITDPTKFSPLFCATVAPMLASYLAGPIIKGQDGAAAGSRLLQQAMGFLARASGSDAEQRRLDIAPAVPWISNR